MAGFTRLSVFFPVLKAGHYPIQELINVVLFVANYTKPSWLKPGSFHIL